jgi:hypothetical protein
MRTYTFERETTINAFFEDQRVAISVERSIRATFGGMPDIVCEELTDSDDSEPQWCITCLTDAVPDKLGDTLEQPSGLITLCNLATGESLCFRAGRLATLCYLLEIAVVGRRSWAVLLKATTFAL